MSYSDTIAAIATGNVISAIGIVRISGDKALTAADNIFKTTCGIRLCDAQDKHIYHGSIVSGSGALIDNCLCFVSRAPKTYTGEDTVELHCHGSPIVLSCVLEELFANGVRQAVRGEFTKRAFLNGRMDLSQAEAVIDLIEAETIPAARNAAGQLCGALSSKMDTIYNKLVDIMAHFHAVIDYPDEDIDEFKLSEYAAVINDCLIQLKQLHSTHERGKILRSGVPTAIAGRTNTGKSSLLNALLGYERAIVTDIAGTTRDTIEEKVLFGGVLLRLIDTAGVRRTCDAIEELGIKRTMAALEKARLVLLVLDGSQALGDEDYEVLGSMAGAAARAEKLIVINKTDLPQCLEPVKLTQQIKDKYSLDNISCISLSALTFDGIDKLADEIQKLFPDFDNTAGGEIITNTRQAQAIGGAVICLELLQKALTEKVSADAALTQIEEALSYIGEVTGKTMRDDIISRIFERFCVGK